MARPKTSPILILVVVLLLLPVIISIFLVGASLFYITLPILVFGALSWFTWRMWGRVLWRANHIAHIRERRLLDEASRR